MTTSAQKSSPVTDAKLGLSLGKASRVSMRD